MRNIVGRRRIARTISCRDLVVLTTSGCALLDTHVLILRLAAPTFGLAR